jgi:hypothetical protein
MIPADAKGPSTFAGVSRFPEGKRSLYGEPYGSHKDGFLYRLSGFPMSSVISWRLKALENKILSCRTIFVGQQSLS